MKLSRYKSSYTAEQIIQQRILFVNIKLNKDIDKKQELGIIDIKF